jgi:hypothetical protein
MMPPAAFITIGKRVRGLRPLGKEKEGASTEKGEGGREGKVRDVARKGGREGGREGGRARHLPSAAHRYFPQMRRARQTCPYRASSAE